MDAVSIDAPAGPPIVLHVSPDGNDGSDGVTQPVATLGRAIAIATANARVIDIELAAGRYTTDRGETFPYKVPPSVALIAGPAGGGAVLAGSPTVSAGLVLSGGQVRDLELDGFGPAISVGSGTVQVTNLRVVNSGTAVSGSMAFNAPAANLHIENLDVSRGTIASDKCVVGISLGGPGEIIATGLTTNGVDTAVFARPLDPVKIDITGAKILTSATSPCNSGVIELRTADITLRDSIIDGGLVAVDFSDTSAVTIIGSTLRHQAFSPISASGTVRITDSLISDTSELLADHGTWTLTGVTVARALSPTGVAFGFSSTSPLAVTMRGCTISDNKNGIKLTGPASVDLGTAASPGNNVIAGNTGVGLTVVGFSLPVSVIGNTWNASVQGADAQGHYLTTTTITGPIAATNGNNFAIADISSIQR